MIVYNYDRITKEYIGAETAYIDKVATLNEGKEVYLIPAYSTTVEPPKKVKEGKVLVFNGQRWEETDNYRGKIIYNIDSRKGEVCMKLGPLPVGYILELKPLVSELKAQYLAMLKANFKQYLAKTKITIPNMDLAFYYSSIDNLKTERELGLVVSRDDNNKIYSDLTREQYDFIINYLLIFGQLIYLSKWEVENAIKKCKNVELMEKLKDKLDIKVDEAHLKSVAKMPEEKRKAYFIRMSNNIK